MYKFLELGNRGGFSTISHRHAIADDNNSLIYLDANNLHGAAMSCYLPVSDFKFLSDFSYFSEKKCATIKK